MAAVEPPLASASKVAAAGDASISHTVNADGSFTYSVEPRSWKA